MTHMMIELHSLFNALDIFSCIILIILIITATLQKHENLSIFHFLSGAMCLLASIAGRIMSGTPLNRIIDASDDASIAQTAFLIVGLICFGLLFISIREFFIHAAGEDRVSAWKLNNRITISVTAAIILAVSIICCIKKNFSVMPVVINSELICGLAVCMADKHFRFNKPLFAVSVMLPVLASVFFINEPEIRLQDSAMTLMYTIMFMQYYTYVDRELIQKELELANSRIQLLTEQISPHFIFNALQSIKGLTESDPDKVSPALDMFSGYLRGNLESLTDFKLIPFRRELEHTRHYIELEQLGDGKQFSVEYNIQTENFMLPPLVLQPLVENAIRYGIGTKADGDRITIETSMTRSSIFIRVKDDGHGKDSITPQQSKRKSIGLDNVRSRLSAQCSGILDIDITEAGTTATIEIPKIVS